LQVRCGSLVGLLSVKKCSYRLRAEGRPLRAAESQEQLSATAISADTIHPSQCRQCHSAYVFAPRTQGHSQPTAGEVIGSVPRRAEVEPAEDYWKNEEPACTTKQFHSKPERTARSQQGDVLKQHKGDKPRHARNRSKARQEAAGGNWLYDKTMRSPGLRTPLNRAEPSILSDSACRPGKFRPSQDSLERRAFIAGTKRHRLR
jgi:hypothetical protein